MLFPAYLWSDHGTRSVPHGKLLQCAQCARPRFPVLHPPAIQHGLSGIWGTTRHDGRRELDHGYSSHAGKTSRGGRESDQEVTKLLRGLWLTMLRFCRYVD